MPIIDKLNELEKLKKEIQKGLLQEKERLEAELAVVIAAIKEHGIKAEKKAKKAKKSKGKRVKVPNEVILKAIGEEKTAKEVSEATGCGYQTATIKLKALVKEKLAVVAKVDGLKIYYKAK